MAKRSGKSDQGNEARNDPLVVDVKTAFLRKAQDRIQRAIAAVEAGASDPDVLRHTSEAVDALLMSCEPLMVDDDSIRALRLADSMFWEATVGLDKTRTADLERSKQKVQSIDEFSRFGYRQSAKDRDPWLRVKLFDQCQFEADEMGRNTEHTIERAIHFVTIGANPGNDAGYRAKLASAAPQIRALIEAKLSGKHKKKGATTVEQAAVALFSAVGLPETFEKFKSYRSKSK